MKERKLSLEDRKTLQLEMLKEVDAFCRDHDIKYALSCGTLIGAVRHKGFIPWDDDVDITMLFSDMLRFRDLFRSDSIEYSDVETSSSHRFHFSSLYCRNTYSKIGFQKSKGVCIDLYPIIECSIDNDVIEGLLPKGLRLFERRMRFLKWESRIRRYTTFKTLPGFHKAMLDYYYFMINDFQMIGGGRYYQIGGALVGNNNVYRNMWTFNPLDELIEVPFENYRFCIPARFDEFLTVRYGNYLQLPPKDQRVPYHGGDYYWK